VGSSGYQRLPPGRHGLSPAEVTADQRRRLTRAASALLAERRLTGLSSRRIARRAGVSSHTFYEHFESVDDVLIAAFADAAQLLVEVVGAGCAADGMPDRARLGALGAALALGADEPGLAALMRVEVAVAIPEVGAERERLVGRLGALPRGRDTFGRREVAVAAALALAAEWLEHGATKGADRSSGELASLLG
jgi:AcrR family transcriptional regulator